MTVKVTAECIPCYLRQCLNAMQQLAVSDAQKQDMLIRLFPLIAGLDRSMTPAENSSIIMHCLVQLIGGIDPFKKAKQDSNVRALKLIENLHKEINDSSDQVQQALRFSVAGNVVDLGLYQEYDLDAAIREAARAGFEKDDYKEFSRIMEKAHKVMIIGDNSGEVVFDRLLVETLQKRGIEVVYSVKGSFIINDATMEDAEQAGITRICKVITNGNNYLGTIEKECSRVFLDEFASSDLVVSKGQANYESLEGTELAGSKTFFLLKAKCPVVAEHLGVGYGALVFVRNTPTVI